MIADKIHKSSFWNKKYYFSKKIKIIIAILLILGVIFVASKTIKDKIYYFSSHTQELQIPQAIEHIEFVAKSTLYLHKTSNEISNQNPYKIWGYLNADQNSNDKEVKPGTVFYLDKALAVTSFEFGDSGIGPNTLISLILKDNQNLNYQIFTIELKDNYGNSNFDYFKNGKMIKEINSTLFNDLFREPHTY